ncbi:MAG TPA: homoserine kinase [Alphaproteobacteria bacterium]|nr:homoserine kinase [Alphaproteobacteria bacterium]
MAVYTEVDDDALEAFLAQYDIGEPLACKGIAEGVENSNFLLQTDRGTYILTLYEKRVAKADLPFFLGLMEHLARAGIPCPTPIHGKDGKVIRELAKRPAAIISFLKGMWPRRIHPEHCGPVGEYLARMHLAGASFEMKRPNALSLEGWKQLYQSCNGRADTVKKGLADDITRELEYAAMNWPRELPAGVIHADLFPDNVFFMHDKLSGMIDFYFACNDFFAYDLAICLNAWCFEPDNSFNATKARRLVGGYTKVRKLEPAEIAALPLFARGSALRFLLTRLYDWLNQPKGALVKPKDPIEYWKKLRFHRSVKSAAAYGL